MFMHVLLLYNNLVTKSVAQALSVSWFRWRVNICAEATGTGPRENRPSWPPTSPHVEPLFFPRAKPTTATLKTCFCCCFSCCGTITAINLGPGPGPATLGPCGFPDSPQAHALGHQANRSAPTPPDHQAIW